MRNLHLEKPKQREKTGKKLPQESWMLVMAMEPVGKQATQIG